MKITAIVLHNYGRGMFWDFYPGDEDHLHHAHNFELDEGTDHLETLAGVVWVLANVSAPEELDLMRPELTAKYSDQVRRYRLRRNRSLSAGDVVVFARGEETLGVLAYAPMGHTRIDEPTFHGDATNAGEVSASYEAHMALLKERLS